MAQRILLHEKRGLLALCVLIYMILCFGSLGSGGEQRELEGDELTRLDSLLRYKLDQAAEPDTPDLNRCSARDLLIIGCPPEIAFRLVSYRDKYGPLAGFDGLDDLYGMTDSLKHWLQSRCILTGSSPPGDSLRDQKIPEPEQNPQAAEREEVKKVKPRVLDLNSASAEELQGLRGIGPVLSERIVKFRNSLGGFHSVEQLAETWGLPPETYESIRKQLVIQHPHRPVAVNLLSADSLAAHAYIPPWTAARIVLEREEGGDFKSLADLQTRVRPKEDFLRKVGPYITFVRRDSLR